HPFLTFQALSTQALDKSPRFHAPSFDHIHRDLCRTSPSPSPSHLFRSHLAPFSFPFQLFVSTALPNHVPLFLSQQFSRSQYAALSNCISYRLRLPLVQSPDTF